MNEVEQRLSALARRYKTDKIDHHSYMGPYSQCLPDKCRSMLEIGVAKGASAQLWSAFYGEDELDLYLMDLYKDPHHVSPRWVRNHGWVPLIGDQSDLDFLSTVDRRFQVIIDDGSHNAHHQLISFKHLFLNNVEPGGMYVIEDLHCNKDRFYYGGFVHNFSDTPLHMLRTFCSEGVIDNDYFNEGESKVFESLIDGVRLYDDKIAFITRKS